VFKSVYGLQIIKLIFSILFINGIIFILDNKLGLFNTLHSSMLQSIESSYYAKKSVYNSNNQSISILISNELFEREFNSQIPLDKNKLDYILKQIIKQNPKRIVFDLDISPDYNFRTTNQSIKHNLYNTLKENSKNIEIVLPFYFIAETKENNILKKQWVSYMCEGNVKFGFPFIYSEIGSVLQYNKNKDHVSLITKHTKNNLCSKVRDNTIDVKEIIDEYSRKNALTERIPINYQQINNSTILINSLNDLKEYDFQNKTIFLGGGYGFDDKYITPYGEKFGVEVLNSIHYSLINELDKNNAILTLIIFDILIGIIFTFLINKVLICRQQTTSENLFVLLNFILVFILLLFYFISLTISAYLFHNMFIWINPVPILIGLFIDSILGVSSSNKTYINKYISLKDILKTIFIILGIYGFINSF